MMKPAGSVQNGLVLRVSVPASGELAVLARDMGAKLAEQLGLGKAHTARIGDTMTELTRQLEARGAAEVSFEFHKLDAELKIEARQDDRAAEARVPLHA